MNDYIPTPTIGEILWEEFMEPLNLSAYKLAQEIHVPTSRIQDILHELELTDLGYHRIAKLGVELRDLRRKRREAANTVDLLGPIVEWKNSNAQAVMKLTQAVGSMRRIDEQHRTAVYHRRIDDGVSEPIIEHRDTKRQKGTGV